MTHASKRLRARLRYLWRDVDAAPLELLCAALNSGFALLLLWPVSGLAPGAHPPAWWGALALGAGLTHGASVLIEVRRVRLPALILGAGFWSGFAAIYGLSAPAPNWVVYTILALAHMWALKRVVTP